MSDAVDPEAFGRSIGPWLDAEADPVPTGLTEDDLDTPLRPWVRERFFHRVYEPHGEFGALELAARKPRTVRLITWRPGSDDGRVSEVFICPPDIPALIRVLDEPTAAAWSDHGVQVTNHPYGLRDLYLVAGADQRVRLVDGDPAGKEWGTVRVDPDHIPDLIAGLERAHQELAPDTPFPDHYAEELETLRGD